MPSRGEASNDDLLTTDPSVAVQRLAAGGVVAIPTETVYGLAADAEQPAAVNRIFDIKGRPRGHPLIVHIAGTDYLDGWVGDTSPATRQAIDLLAASCWPGPLTMLVPAGSRVHPSVTGGRTTVGLRVPAHPLTLWVLEQLGGGLAAPSANRFGRVSPTTARHVLDDLGALLDPRTDAVLDGGPSPVGVESTIVDLTTSPPQVLRAGAIDVEQIERILVTEVAGGSGPSRASGMLAAHYAPRCEVLLADTSNEARQISGGLTAQFGGSRRVRVLDRTDDLVAAARMLYADLRAADDDGVDTLVVVLPPAAGIGHAVRDRLVKAAVGSRRDPTSRAD